MRDEVAQEQAARQGADGIVAEGARQRGEDGREAEQPTDLVRARRRLPRRVRLRVSEPKPDRALSSQLTRYSLLATCY